jgi:hypothetical protein
LCCCVVVLLCCCVVVLLCCCVVVLFFGALISQGTFPTSADHVEIRPNVQRNSMYRKIGPSYSNWSL